MNIPRSFVLPEKIRAQQELRILRKLRELQKFAIRNFRLAVLEILFGILFSFANFRSVRK